MNPDELAFGFLEYVVFLLSTTCHEAAHSLAAKLGGDTTASEGGQVSLNPIPHIRRSPFGMVVMPLLGIITQTGLIGWASAPYDPVWSRQHPKRAAWMSLAGPGANFSLCIVSAVTDADRTRAEILHAGELLPQAHISGGGLRRAASRKASHWRRVSSFR